MGVVLGDGEVHDAVGEGVVVDDAVFALGDGADSVAVGEGGVGDAPGVGVAGDVDGEGAAGDSPGVGAAGDAGVQGLAGGAMVDGVAHDALMVRVLLEMLRFTVPLVMTMMRVLQVTVLGVGPRMGGCRRFWARALATPGGGPRRRWWSVGSSVLSVLVASGVGVAPRQSWRRVPLVRLMVRLVQLKVLSMLVSWALQVWQNEMPRVRLR